MPTPFYHLWIAQDLLAQAGLAQETSHFLKRNCSAFLFGNTAPDVQTLSGQPRRVTHFFPYPVPPTHPQPIHAMLSRYPELKNPARLPEAQAAFLAGYFCHLHADWLWVMQVYTPFFGPGACWGKIHDCVYIHNVLRAYLDRKVLPSLAEDTGAILQQAQPTGWLPCTEDRFLCQWRDYLTSQLEPHAAVQTVEVFAARQGISVELFYNLLDSDERMQQEVFIRLSPQKIEAYRAQLLEESIQLLSRYLERPPKGAYRHRAAGVVIP